MEAALSALSKREKSVEIMKRCSVGKVMKAIETLTVTADDKPQTESKAFVAQVSCIEV